MILNTLLRADTINSTTIAIKINPIILDKALMPEAPKTFTIKKELLSTTYIRIEAAKIAPRIMNTLFNT